MAVDYIPMQALSMQCARVFPSAAKRDAPLCRSTSHDLFESMQVLKYGLGMQCLLFTSHLVNMKAAQDQLEKQAEEGLGIGASDVFTAGELQKLF